MVIGVPSGGLQYIFESFKCKGATKKKHKEDKLLEPPNLELYFSFLV